MAKTSIKNIIRLIVISVLVCAVVLVLSYFVFQYVKMKTEARQALREAKNAALAIRLYDIKEYSLSQSVFDTSCDNNISEGALQAVYDDLEHECYISLISYDMEERKVTNFIYGYNDYIVEYKYEDGNDIWRVMYTKTVLAY